MSIGAAKPETAVFVTKVRNQDAAAFGEWLHDIHGDARRFRGFRDVATIRTDRADSAEFVTLLTFDSATSLNDWTASPIRRDWVAQLSGFLSEAQSTGRAGGLDLWFTLPQKTTQPAFWKQVVLGTITVYPMILILNFLLAPLIGTWPVNAQILIVVIILSALLTWPIMPAATFILRRWLYG